MQNLFVQKAKPHKLCHEEIEFLFSSAPSAPSAS